MSQKEPLELTLKPARYAWCRCGQSGNQPFCDGTHRSGDFTPLIFEMHEEKKVFLCGCKHTHNPPFCDGTHKKF